MSPTKQAKSQWRQREVKKATVARNQNSTGDRMEKKTLGEPRLSVCGYRNISYRTLGVQ